MKITDPTHANQRTASLANVGIYFLFSRVFCEHPRLRSFWKFPQTLLKHFYFWKHGQA